MLPVLTPKTLTTSIPIADKPPLLGGVISAVSQDEFCRLFGLPLQEGIWSDATLLQNCLQEAKQHLRSRFNASQSHSQIEHAIDNPFENVCIAYIDDQVGYGVFATKFIKKAPWLLFTRGKLLRA